MIERNIWQSFLPVLVLIIIVHCLLMFAAGSVYSQEPGSGYFYLQEKEYSSSRNSCANIFAALKNGTEDVGGVIKSLKSINVNYLLGDYDNSLSSDRRKVNYLKFDDLMREVEENRREIYCRTELAIYMKNHDSFAGPAYGMLLDEAFLKLDETYSSATKSLQREDFARAIYAFDLIAPYNDSYGMSQKAAKLLRDSDEKIAKTLDSVAQEEIPEQLETLGPIAMAGSVPAGGKENEGTVASGPIVMAARLGAITQAVNLVRPADGEM